MDTSGYFQELFEMVNKGMTQDLHTAMILKDSMIRDKVEAYQKPAHMIDEYNRIRYQRSDYEMDEDRRIMSYIKDYQKLSEMVEKEMTIGDIVIADNIFVEYEKGVSIENLAIKYEKTSEEITGILKSMGAALNDD